MGVKLTDFGSQNLKAKGMPEKLNVVVDGSSVKTYDSTTDDGREYVKKIPALKVHYQDAQGKTVYVDFVLNRENRDTISRTGIIDLDALIGANIELLKVPVIYKDSEVMGIRIGKITLVK